MRRALEILLFLLMAALVVGYIAKDYEATDSYADLWSTIFGFLRYFLLPWILWALIAASGYVVGSWFMGIRLPVGPKIPIRPKTMSRAEDIIISIAIGLALLAIFAWILGWIGFFQKWFFVLLIVGILAAGYKVVPRMALDSWKIVRRQRWNQWLWIVFLIWAVYSMLLATNPSIGGDPIRAHLYAPKWYFMHGRVQFVEYFDFLQVHGMFAAFMMSVIPDPTAVIPCFFMFASAGMIYLMGRRWLSPLGATIGAIIYMLMPMSHVAASQFLLEHILDFYILLSLHAMLRWHEDGDKRWLFIAGAAAGTSAGIDINGLVPTLFIAILSLRGAGYLLLWAVVFASPWYLPNTLHFGDPLFPFYQEWFKWIPWGTMKSYVASASEQHGNVGGASIKGMPAFFWYYTFAPDVYWAKQMVGRNGPFLLALTPFLIFPKWRKPAIMLGIFVLLAYLYWFGYEQVYHPRWLMYIAAVHGLLGAWGLSVVIANKGWFQHVARIFLGFVIILLGFTTTLASEGPAIPFVMPRSRAAYLLQQKPGLMPILALNRQKEPVKAYLLSLEDYRFYCDFDIVGGRFGKDNQRIYFENSDSPARLHEWLKSLRCNALLINVDYMTKNPYNLDFSAVTKDPTWATYFRKANTVGAVDLYLLN
jgi:hypothetical protein